jgi:pectate lyase
MKIEQCAVNISDAGMRDPATARFGGLWLAVLGLAAALHAAPAFPGAEGFGTDTPGGRGGRVLVVTNLQAAGPGSLAWALAEKGPRIVVFAVGGTIRLERDLFVDEPFLTLDAQGAPGDGICLRGAALRIRTHDVVVRYLRCRVGDDPRGPPPENRDAIGVGSDRSVVHHVVLDHCSVSWAIDENIQLWHPCHDITVQWCLIGEALEHSLHPKGSHGMGLLVGDHARRVSVHHNLFVHNQDRSPLLKGDTEAEVINNVVYNWRWYATGLTDLEGSGPQRADIIGNTYLPGPQTKNRFGIGLLKTVKAGSAVHLRGNVGPGRERDEGDEWLAAVNRAAVTPRADAPTLAGSRVTMTTAAAAYPAVLRQAGAIRPVRDGVDERLVHEIGGRTGRMIDSPRDVGPWPEYRPGTPRPDADRDGLPDDWERAQGLDPANPADSARIAARGYAWIEEWLNSADAALRSP